MAEMTWADVDRLKAEHDAKKRECVERLAKILTKEFSFPELQLVQYADGHVVSPVIVEAFEIARNNTKAG